MKLITANTFDNNISNKFDRDIDMVDRCKKYGKDALVIKATDIVDNSYYYYFCENEAQFQKLMRENEVFHKYCIGGIIYRTYMEIIIRSL